MLFTEEQLSRTIDPFRLLDEAIYLEPNEVRCQAVTIPICENQRLGTHTVSIDDVVRLSEENGYTYLESLSAIAEANGLDASQLTVSIQEADAIEDPTVVQEFESIVVSPILEDDPVFLFCEAATDVYLDTEDDTALDLIVNEANIGSEFYQTFLRRVASDAGKMDKNPLNAYQGVKNLGPMYARWGWDQNPIVRNIAFFKHPTIQAMLGHRGADGVARYRSAISDMVKGAGSTPAKAKAKILQKFEDGMHGMEQGALDPLEGRYKGSKFVPKSRKKSEWKQRISDVIDHIHSVKPSSPSTTTGSKSSNQTSSGTSVGSKIASILSGGSGSNHGSGGGSNHSSSNGSTSGSSNSRMGNVARILGVGTAAAAGSVGAYKLVQAYRNKPRSVVAKKIASLRKVYSRWMQRAQSSREPGVASQLKKGAAKILQVIDRLMEILQKKADGR